MPFDAAPSPEVIATPPCNYLETPRVAAAFLDYHFPSWVSKVDPDHLYMSSFRYCVLGQLFGDFGFGLDALRAHGAIGIGPFGGWDEEWRELIQQRRAQEKAHAV